MKPIRVLHIVTSMNMGGIENFIMNAYRHIDRSRVQFDFLKHRNSHDYFDEEILGLGGRIFTVPPINPFRQKKYDAAVAEFFYKHVDEYKIVHSHLNTFSAYPLKIAKEAGIQVRIAHSHAATTKIDVKTPFRVYTKHIISKYMTDALACSDSAGKWLFGKNGYEVFSNAIETERYIKNSVVRKAVRDKYGLGDSYVVGMVANFSKVKNHEFIVKVFSKLIKQQPNTRLVLVGDGTTRTKIEKLAIKLGLNERIVFAGIQGNVADFLQAFDVFVLPSFTEGFAISALEAETMGIPCILSTGVPVDVKIFDEMDTVFLPTNDIEKWTESLVNCCNAKRKNWNEQVSKTTYNATNSALRLMEYYESKYRMIEEQFL